MTACTCTKDEKGRGRVLATSLWPRASCRGRRPCLNRRALEGKDDGEGSGPQPPQVYIIFENRRLSWGSTAAVQGWPREVITLPGGEPCVGRGIQQVCA